MTKQDDEIQGFIDKLTKQFGAGSVFKFGEALSVETISTGSLTLDLALGVGGLPKGRITEIFGPEASGKSTLCMHVIAEAQKSGGRCAYIDMEHAFDPVYASKIGVNIQELYMSQPDDGETALELCEAFVRSGKFAVVVVDSIAALVPRKELEGDAGDSVVGVMARMMAQAMRKLVGAINVTKTVVVFTNQLRQKIGVMFGNPETTPGGLAIRYAASVRLDIRRIQALKQGDTVIGGRTRVKVVKNKVAAPFRVAEFDIIFSEGISRLAEIIDVGINTGVLTKRGSFIYYGDTKVGQGKENAKEFLRANVDLRNLIEGEIKTKIDAGIGVLGNEDEDEE